MIDSLKARWQQYTGEPMPDDIAGLSVLQIRKAVELTEAGMVVFIPKAAVIVPVSADDSLQEWDTQDDKHLNAYGQ